MARGPGRTSGEASFNVSATLDVAQTKALKLGIRNAGPAARKEIRAQFKAVGTIAQTEIRGRTPAQSGLLRRSTKLKIGTLSVKVYNDAKAVSRRYPGGYRYGKRLEFDPQFGSRYAFFYPGWAAVAGRVREAFDKVLEAARKAYLK
jgi:hypothetical protein